MNEAVVIVRVVRSLDPEGLDKQAVVAAAQWRFEPGRLVHVLIRPLEINSLERLAIRCDDSGEVWVSIQPDDAAIE